MEGGYESMSTTIDQKVVEMQFDNKQFESGVSTTMSTLEKLKKSLNFKDSSKELENFSYTVGLSLQDIKNKMWSLLEYDIAGKLKNQIMNITKALTITPITTGFNEYELKMGSIQTIMAGTGESLETVNKYLGELNEYSDKTIYSFQDMTSNIGKFTNAGVSLEDSVAAIKGVSNVAAVSGANANEASRAMYNFAQALSSGYVKLIDWKSIELANMGTVEFKNQLLEAAVAEGKLTKTSDGLYKTLSGTTVSATKNFNDSLKDEWMTTEVLIGTLKKYADETTDIGKKATKAATEVKTLSQLYDTLKESAQSGWAQTWEIIVGDFEEAKKFLSELNDIIGGFIGKSAEARNALLENWKVLGGRDELIQVLRNSFEAILSVIKPIKEAFRELFPPLTSEKLFALTEGLQKFTAKLILSDRASENLKRVFKGLFSILSIGVEIFSAVWEGLGLIFDGATDAGGGLLGIAAIIGDIITAFATFIKETKIIRTLILAVAKTIKFVLNIVGTLLSAFSGAFTSGPLEVFNRLLEDTQYMFGSISDSAVSFGDALKTTFKNLGNSLQNSSLFQFLKTVWNTLKVIGSAIAKTFGDIFRSIGDAFAGGDLTAGLDFINALLSGGLIIALTSLVKKIRDLFGGKDSFIGIIKSSLKDITESVSEYIGAMTSSIKAGALKSIAQAILMLTISLIALSLINKDKLTDALAAMSLAFGELLLVFAVLGKINGAGIANSGKTIIAAIGMALALAVLSSVIKKIGAMEWAEWGRGLMGVTVLLGALVGAQIMLNRLTKESSNVKDGLKSMRNMALTLLLISIPMRIIGAMEWEEWGRGLLGVTILLGALTGVQVMMSHLAKGSDDIIKGAGAMTIMAIAIQMLVPPLLILGLLPIGTLIQGGLGLVGVLAALAGAQIMLTKLAGTGKKMLAGAGAVAIIAASIDMLIPPLLILGLLPIGTLIQGVLGLASVLAALAGAQIMLTKLAGGGKQMILGATSLVIMAAAINLLVPALLALSLIPAILLAKSLGALAGALAIFAFGAKLLTPIVPTILAIAGAIALFGAGALLASTALLVFGHALVVLAAGILAIGGSIGTLAVGITALVAAVIAGIIKGIGKGIVALCDVLMASLPKIAGVISALIFALCDVLIENVPKIVSTVLTLVVEILSALSKFTPQIVESLIDLIVGIINALAAKLPDICKAVVDLLFAFIQGVINALAGMDSSGLEQALLNMSMLTAIMAELAAMALLAPLAMTGTLLMGLVITELSLVLTALSKLSGLKDSIEAGGEVLHTIGKAMGKFIGGFAEGMTASLPQIATDLTNFMTNLQGFIDGANQISPSMLEGVKSLVGVVLAITGAEILQGITRFITGGNNIAHFSSEIVALGLGLKGFAMAVDGIDSNDVSAAATAAKTLAEMTNTIPNSGGIVSWFSGDNSITKFAAEIPLLGLALKGFAVAVTGVNAEAVKPAIEAAKALAEMTTVIPNTGGIIAWFAGENSIANFAGDMVSLGVGLKGFAIAVTGVTSETVTPAIEAAKALAEMTSVIPNTGGVVAWFAGENSIVKFADSLPELGAGLKGFADATIGIVPETIVAAANAAKALAEMTSVIPNEGGVVSWFAGESSISKFGGDLVSLGQGIKGFADETAGITPETVTAAANACKALAEMTAAIPNEGGVTAWFSGESSISKFGTDLVSLGKGIKGFADETAGITPETVSAASEAAKNLAAMVEVIPSEGGIKAWFSGETSLSKFSEEIPKLGKGLKGFSESVAGINAENISAAATAAKSLAEMTAVIPKEGGIKAWFSGESGISAFADKLPALGKGLSGFSESVAGIKPENVSAAAEAAKNLAEMTKTAPKDSSKILSFGDNLKSFGSKLAEYFKQTKSITADSTSAASKAIETVKGIANINSGNIKSVAGAIKELTNAIKNMASNIKTDLKTAGKDAIEAFISGIDSKLSSAETACKDVLNACVKAMSGKSSSFESAGKAVVQGFADGISKNTYIAEAKAAAMATAAYEAAKEALDVNSPSKIFRELGTSIPEGLAVGIDKLSGTVKDSAIGMTDVAVKSVSDSVSKIANAINTDIDMQPSIRPVVDLSNIESGARAINGLFSSETSVGVQANVRAINSMMSKQNQNGTNNDIVSAIGDLGKRIDKLEHPTYNINGVDLSGDQAVVDAFTTIIRAARMERRS